MTKTNPNPYPFIYTNQCIYCYNEGRPQCHLEETENNNASKNATESHNNMPPYLAVYMWERVG